jgi:hypothetical protein
MKLRIEASALKGFTKECINSGLSEDETLRMAKRAFAHEFFQNPDYRDGYMDVIKSAGIDFEKLPDEFVEDCLMDSAEKMLKDELA